VRNITTCSPVAGWVVTPAEFLRTPCS